ncbi:alpha/beta-Hydrolases superfamily protein [Striga hermonthica]|uniref:Alpha/beta-Hydrolases superfamily protein n=1 Tax=Striga hermonthica TaxID=68872 RepID=A0A9N7NIG5_STRHE|nr:alpha/beta-Hydrolases superfamily protein [Striga hermonthica]
MREIMVEESEELYQETHNSISDAILEWDRTAALSDFVLLRPSGAPRAVLALRGTLLKGPTIGRDIKDDLRFLTWESLKGSVRFERALKALKEISVRYESNNVCVAGHSLGVGFALQVGKELAKEGKEEKKRVPHLYINSSVDICCYYNDPVVETRGIDGSGEDNENDVNAAAAAEAEAKLFVLSRGILGLES